MSRPRPARCSCRSCIQRSLHAVDRQLMRGHHRIAHAIVEELLLDLLAEPVDRPLCPRGRLAGVAMLMLSRAA